MPRDETTPRRRSVRSHRAVMAATLAEVEEHGYRKLTIDAVCRRAGVGKATVYRWWPNKAALFAEAFLESVEDDLAFPDTGTVRDDLVAQVLALVDALTARRAGRVVVTLLGEAQEDEGLRDALRDRWQRPRREAGAHVIARAITRGELHAASDADVLLDLIYGSVYLRLIFGHAGLTPDEVARLVDGALGGNAG